MGFGPDFWMPCIALLTLPIWFPIAFFIMFKMCNFLDKYS